MIIDLRIFTFIHGLFICYHFCKLGYFNIKHLLKKTNLNLKTEYFKFQGNNKTFFHTCYDRVVNKKSKPPVNKFILLLQNFKQQNTLKCHGTKLLKLYTLSSAKRPHESPINVHFLSHKKQIYRDEQQFFILT